MKKRNRLFSLLLALAMVLTYMPALAFAEPDNGGEGDKPYRFEPVDPNNDVLYSDGEIQFRLPSGLAIPVGAHLDLTVGYSSYNPGDEYSGWPVRFTKGTEYQYDEQNNILTIYGDKAYQKLGDEYDRIDIFGGALFEPGDGRDGWLIDGGCEFRIARGPVYDLERDRDMLPGWDGYIPDSRGVWADDADHPDYHDEYNITGVSVTSGSDLLENGGVKKEKDGWSFRIRDWSGTEDAPDENDKVTFKVTYELLDSSSTTTYTFAVNVTDTVYSVDAGSDDGYWQGLPGTTMDLTAYGEKQYIEKKNGRWEHEETSEGLDFKWEVSNGELASIARNEGSHDKAVLTFIDRGEDNFKDDDSFDVKVDLYEAGTNKKLASWQEDFYVEDEFYRISPGKLENSDLPVGESITITPELEHLTYNNGTPATETVQNAEIILDNAYDRNALDISKENGTFTITRKGNWDTEFRLKWNDPNNADIGTEQEYHFNWVDVQEDDEGGGEEYYPWKVVFNGDSQYEWAHFYSVDGDDATLSYDDLKITVIDEKGITVDPKDYTLSLKRTWYDETEKKDMEVDAPNPLGIHESDKTIFGYTEYVAVVTRGEGDNTETMARNQFIVMDKYSLTFFCSDVSFNDSIDTNGWRMASRWFVAKDEMADPIIKSNDGTTLTEGTDYEVTYYSRKADPDFTEDSDHLRDDVMYMGDDNKLEGRPTETGGYLVKITGKGSYYGENLILLDILENENCYLSEDKGWTVGTAGEQGDGWARYFVNEGSSMDVPEITVRKGETVLDPSKYNVCIEKEKTDRYNEFDPVGQGEKLIHAEDGSQAYRITITPKADSGLRGRLEKWVDVCSRTCLTPDGSDVSLKGAEKYKIMEDDPQFVGWQGAYRIPKGKTFSTVLVIDGVTLAEGRDYTCQFGEIDEIWYDRDALNELESKGKLVYKTGFPKKKGIYAVKLQGTGAKGSGYYGKTSVLRIVIKDSNEDVEKVQKAIDALDTGAPDANAVANARAAFNNLSESEKALVNTAKLTAAENRLAQIENEKAAAGEKAAAEEKARAEAQELQRIRSVTTVTVNKATLNAAAVNKAIAAAGGSKDYVTNIVVGSKVNKISKNTFKGLKVKTLTVKSKKLTAKSVKNSLKGSSVKTVKVKVGSKKQNKTYVKKYKKIFTKKNAGKKVSVK